MFGYDLKQAATYFFKDDKKNVKLIVLYILSIMNVALNNMKDVPPYLLLLVIPLLYFYGYNAKNNNLRILKRNDNLPELNDWKNYLLLGFKNIAGFVLYFLIFVIIFGIFTLLIPFALKINNFFMTTLAIILLIAGIFLFIIMMLAIEIAFSINLKFRSMFNFKLLKQIIFENYKSFLQLISVSIILGIANVAISAVLAITIVGIILIPLLYLYLLLIMSDLYGQFISKSIKLNEG